MSIPFVVCTGRAGEFIFCSFEGRAGKFTGDREHKSLHDVVCTEK